MNGIVGIVQIIHTFMDSAWMLFYLSQQIFQDVINDVLGLQSSPYKIYQTASGKYTWERFCKNVTLWHILYRGKPIAYRGKHIGRWCWMSHSNVLWRCNDRQHWERFPRLDSKSGIGVIASGHAILLSPSILSLILNSQQSLRRRKGMC